MNLNSFERKTNFVVLIIIFVISFLIYRSFVSISNEIKHSIKIQFNEIHMSLKSESQIITKFVSTGRKFAENYFTFNKTNQSQWWTKLKFDSKFNGSFLDNLPESYISQKYGSLTTNTNVKQITKFKQTEMNMALELGSFFASVLKENKISPWFYYTSDDFIYIAPYIEPKDFFFNSKTLLEKEFYKNALPKNNPERKGFWTSVYVDEAGLGLMITYSEPVYNQEQFTGAISMDVTIDQFNNVLKNHKFQVGKYILVNDSFQVLAAPSIVESADKNITHLNELIPLTLFNFIKESKNTSMIDLINLDSRMTYFEYFPELNSTLIYYVNSSELRNLTLIKLTPILALSILSILLILWLRHTIINDYNLQQNLIQNAKMSALGRMAAGMAHEINNPLAIIITKINNLKRLLEKNKLTDTVLIQRELEKIENTTHRIGKIINSLRSFSRNGSQDPVIKVNFSKWLNETLELCHQRFTAHSIQLNLSPIPEVNILCRDSELSQVLVNLLNNSVDAVLSKEVRMISISFEIQKDFILLFVRDNGHGIPIEVQTRLMEPFFTTKAPGSGTGLGLSISMGIMKEHGGSLSYLAEENQTCFVMKVPLSN